MFGISLLMNSNQLDCDTETLVNLIRSVNSFIPKLIIIFNTWEATLIHKTSLFSYYFGVGIHSLTPLFILLPLHITLLQRVLSHFSEVQSSPN